MKTTELFVHLSAWLLIFPSAQAQVGFQNLNFESATLAPIPSGQYGGEVPISSALPGWNASIGGVSLTQVLQNNYTLGEAMIDVLGPSWSFTEPGIINGNYSVYLQAFYVTEGNVSLWQNGTIPANAESLQFKASIQPLAGSFSVSFAGNSLSPVVLSVGQSPSGQPYDVYGANISAYAGQTGQLEFTALDNNSAEQIELDDITFSTNYITPEPSTWALLVMGGLTFGVRSWRKRVKASRQDHKP
jgi:hypothetical protein